MQKILVTGNGFDLAQGLPTKYSDFITTLNKLKEKNTNIDSKYESYFNVNDKFNHIVGKDLFEIVRIEKLNRNLDNIWFNFFSNQLKIDTWIDFETKLENSLLEINDFLNYIKNQLFIIDQFYLDFSVKHLSKKNSLKISLLENLGLIKLKDSFNSDVFSLNPIFCKKNTNRNSFFEFDEIKFYSFLNDEWIKFMKLFNDYLDIFVQPLINEIKIDVVFSFSKHFTFNYTNTYTKVLSNDIVTEHLHGSINNFEKSNIVLGFNRSELTEIKNFIPFTKNFQRIIFNTDFNFLYDFGDSLYNTDIYIWGHSLDITDKFFLDQIIYNIQLKENVKTSRKRNVNLIILFKDSYERLLQNLIYIYGDKIINDLYMQKKIRFLEAIQENIEKELKNKNKVEPIYKIR